MTESGDKAKIRFGGTAVIFILIVVAVVCGFFIFFQTESFLFTGNLIPEKQPQISWPPKTIKAVYLTAWSATSRGKIDYAINLASTTEINALVIDIKDWSGKIFYDAKIPEAEKYKTKRNLIPIKSLLAELRGRNIYTIARIVVFQDPALASARPDFAIHKKSDNSVWLDNKGLSWVDPASREVWDYNVKLAQDALSQGFDEVNFDYVRFPSDGNLEDISFSVWDGKTPKNIIIRDFFRYLRKKMPDAILSVDLFGLTTVAKDDVGVGQIIEDAYENFNFVSPMIYPSHYAPGFHGYENPAEHASEVIQFSLERALERLKIYTASSSLKVELRPWLQDFNLGAIYDKERVRSEIDAVEKAMGNNFAGFIMWNPRNNYTVEALYPKSREQE